MRWFNSRQAGLVLVWNILITATSFTFAGQASHFFSIISDRVLPANICLVTVIVPTVILLVIIVAALLSGWLADSRYGNYRIFKMGSLILFVTAVINCLASLIFLSILISGMRFAIVPILLAVVYGAAICSVFACSSVLIQLGLDQMPDASSDSIASFIFWYLGSLVTGLWIGSSIYTLLVGCISQTTALLVLSLFPVLFDGCVLCLDFLLSRKWLIIESSSPQSLKHIFRVLKFAVKHKAPLNRSALTYWEEDIPSRMDLAKSRYGGPFTTEQVEDVNTFLKLLVVFLPLWLIVPAVVAHGFDIHHVDYIAITNLSQCATRVIYIFSYSPLWCSIFGTFLHELCIWPLINIRLPSLLKRVGVASIISALLNLSHLGWTIISSHVAFSTQSIVLFQSIYTIIAFIAVHLLLAFVFEFICAQSPYSSRALMIGYTIVIVALALVFGFILDYAFHRLCTKYCSVIRDALTLAMAVVGFILHCILTHWYKRRVRDDIDTPHKWVEEVYDRYLSHYDVNN